MNTIPPASVHRPRASCPRFHHLIFGTILALFFGIPARPAFAQADPQPVSYCGVTGTTLGENLSDYYALETSATTLVVGDYPDCKDLSQYVLEAFAKANFDAKTTLEHVGPVTTALQRLQMMWVSSTNNFAWQYSGTQSVASDVTDPNAVEFITEALVQIPIRYPHLLSQHGGGPTSIEGMLSSLLADGQTGALNHTQATISYTNQYLMRCCNLVLTSQGLVDGSNNTVLTANTTTLNTGRTALMSWLSTVQAQGVHEFMSPCYTGVDMECLGNIDLLASDRSIAALADQGYKLLWIDLYANWHQAGQRVGGTHSRTYDFLMDNDHGTDRFYYAASSYPFTNYPLMTTRSVHFWWGQDYVSYVLRPPADVPGLFGVFPRTILRNFTDGGSPLMYAENYMANPQGTGASQYYPYSIGTAQIAYNDPTFEGFTIGTPGDRYTPNINFNTQSRNDYYLQNPVANGSGVMKSTTLKPFIESVQNKSEVLFLAASNGNSSSSPNPQEVASTIIFSSSANLFYISSTNALIPLVLSGSAQTVIPGNSTLFIETPSNSGQHDFLVTGIRFLLATTMSGHSNTLTVANDGANYNAPNCARVTCEHIATPPTGGTYAGYGTIAFWSRTAYCANSGTDTLANFCGAMSSSTATVTSSLNWSNSTGNGAFALSVQRLGGPQLSLTGTLSPSGSSYAPVTGSIAGGDVQSAYPAPLFDVSGTEFVSTTVQSWHTADIAGFSGTATMTTAGSPPLYTGQIIVSGSGGDIFGTSDSFHYYYQDLNGDGTVTCRLTGLPSGGGINSGAKAGIMLRDGTSASAANAYMEMYGTNGQRFSYRPVTSGSTFRTGPATPSTTTPCWFQLIRSGSNFSGYIAVNSDQSVYTGAAYPTAPVQFSQVGSTEPISMSQTICAGIAVTSKSGPTLSGTFEQVSILQE